MGLLWSLLIALQSPRDVGVLALAGISSESGWLRTEAAGSSQLPPGPLPSTGMPQPGPSAPPLLSALLAVGS